MTINCVKFEKDVDSVSVSRELLDESRRNGWNIRNRDTTIKNRVVIQARTKNRVVTYLIALLSAKTFNEHPPLFAENLIIANSLSSNEYCITNVRI